MTVTPATGRYRHAESGDIVQAVHVDVRDIAVLAAWVGGIGDQAGPVPHLELDDGTEVLPGDWILVAEDGTFSRLTDGAFFAGYTAAYT